MRLVFTGLHFTYNPPNINNNNNKIALPKQKASQCVWQLTETEHIHNRISLQSQGLFIPQSTSFLPSGILILFIYSLACKINTVPENISDQNFSNAYINVNLTAFSMTIKQIVELYCKSPATSIFLKYLSSVLVHETFKKNPNYCTSEGEIYFCLFLVELLSQLTLISNI